LPDRRPFKAFQGGVPPAALIGGGFFLVVFACGRPGARHY